MWRPRQVRTTLRDILIRCELTAIVAGSSAAGKPAHIGAAHQAVEARLLRAARAGRVEIGWVVARPAIVAVPSAAVGAAIAPVAVARAATAEAGATTAALPAWRADSGTAGSAGATCTTDQAMPAGMLRAGGAAAPLVGAVMSRRPGGAAQEHRGKHTTQTQSPQHAASGVSSRQRSRPGIESSLIHLGPAYRVTNVRLILFGGGMSVPDCEHSRKNSGK